MSDPNETSPTIANDWRLVDWRKQSEDRKKALAELRETSEATNIAGISRRRQSDNQPRTNKDEFEELWKITRSIPATQNSRHSEQAYSNKAGPSTSTDTRRNNAPNPGLISVPTSITPRDLVIQRQSGYVDDRRVAAAASRAANPTVRAHTGQLPANLFENLVTPQWYHGHLLARNFDRALAKELEEIMHDAKALRRISRPPNEQAVAVRKFHTKVQQAFFNTRVNRDVIKASGILNELGTKDARGIPTLMKEVYGKFLPDHVRSDLVELFKWWADEHFDGDLFWGIKYQDENGGRQSYSVDKMHPKYRAQAFKEFGSNGLQIGQWWPSQLATIRDGAHGASQGGVSGNADAGTYSIIMKANSEYHDADEGDIIHYTGTKSRKGADKPTPATSWLLVSLRTGNVIRLLRGGGGPSGSSAKMPKSSFAPPKGLRYDGLYRVIDAELKEDDTHHYRFKLVRIRGQRPIRYQGPEERPNPSEKAALQAHQNRLRSLGRTAALEQLDQIEDDS